MTWDAVELRAEVDAEFGDLEEEQEREQEFRLEFGYLRILEQKRDQGRDLRSVRRLTGKCTRCGASVESGICDDCKRYFASRRAAKVASRPRLSVPRLILAMRAWGPYRDGNRWRVISVDENGRRRTHPAPSFKRARALIVEILRPFRDENRRRSHAVTNAKMINRFRVERRCSRCGRQRDGKAAYCAKCREYMRIYRREYRARKPVQMMEAA